MSLYVIVQEATGLYVENDQVARAEPGFMIVAVEGSVLAFERRIDAEDHADQLDEPGEFFVIEYQPDMGPCVVVV